MHPDAVIAIAASSDGQALTKQIFGDDIGWLPWIRPGFELGLRLQRFVAEHPNGEGSDPRSARPLHLGRDFEGSATRTRSTSSIAPRVWLEAKSQRRPCWVVPGSCRWIRSAGGKSPLR